MAKQKRGKRYSATEKATILKFVQGINAEKGRGGVSAAARKFGVSQLTVASWLRNADLPTTGKAAKTATSKGFGANLRRLADLHDEIANTKAKLAALEKEFVKLKKKL